MLWRLIGVFTSAKGFCCIEKAAVCLFSYMAWLIVGHTAFAMSKHPSQAIQGHNRPHSFYSISRNTLCKIFVGLSSDILTSEKFHFEYNKKRFLAVTTLHMPLQRYLDDLMLNSSARVTAIVCLNPVSGKVMAMAGFDRTGESKHVWTEYLVPAASLFKIVTAAGAIELHGMTPETVLNFLGGRHTLYRYQLKDIRKGRGNIVTLQEAFAKSINPVFGKIGAKYLKRDGLLMMARRFLWQQPIPFELPVKKGVITIKDTRFNLAEVASGFNKTTRLTALQAALMSAGIANGGTVMAPFFIDYVIDLSTGEKIYQSNIYPIKKSIGPDTVSALKKLMISTIKKGTAKKAFKNADKDAVLRRLVIGGKTGTIDNVNHTIRYDLFSGFACNEDSTKCIAVGVFVGHGKVLGMRSVEYAREAMKKYFETIIQ